MENKIKLYQKLHKIQVAISGLSKDKDSQGYSYVSGNKVLSHVKPLMNEYGLILKQEIIEFKNTRQDYHTGYRNDKPTPKHEIFTETTQRFTWIDSETGETDVNLFASNGMNDWDKGMGSALTYAERYFLLKFFKIATDEDDIDNPNRKAEQKVDKIDQNAKKSGVDNRSEFTKDNAVYSDTKKWLQGLSDKNAGLLQLEVKYKVSDEVKKDLLDIK